MELYKNALNKLDLSELQKIHIQQRVIKLLQKYKRNRFLFSTFYYGGKIVVTLGSILVPSLMSRDLYNNSMDVYWTVFIISLFVTIANGFLTAFNIDTKFYVTQNVNFQAQSEFWQFYGLSGKYSGFYINGILNHSNQCKYFLNNIEKINMNYIERIYSKNIEKIDTKNIEEAIKRVVPSNFPVENKIEDTPKKKELSLNVIDHSTSTTIDALESTRVEAEAEAEEGATITAGAGKRTYTPPPLENIDIH